MSLINRSLALPRESWEFSGGAKALVKEPSFSRSRDLYEAIALLREHAAEIEEARDVRLFAYSHQSFVGFLTLSGRHKEAKRLLPYFRLCSAKWLNRSTGSSCGERRRASFRG